MNHQMATNQMNTVNREMKSHAMKNRQMKGTP